MGEEANFSKWLGKADGDGEECSINRLTEILAEDDKPWDVILGRGVQVLNSKMSKRKLKDFLKIRQIIARNKYNAVYQEHHTAYPGEEVVVEEEVIDFLEAPAPPPTPLLPQPKHQRQRLHLLIQDEEKEAPLPQPVKPSRVGRSRGSSSRSSSSRSSSPRSKKIRRIPTGLADQIKMRPPLKKKTKKKSSSDKKKEEKTAFRCNSEGCCFETP